MVEVEIRSPVADGDSGEVKWIVCATVRADGPDLVCDDPSGVLDPELPILDVATGRQVHGDEAETWARNLPHAFRAGDLVAIVVSDSDPPSAQADPVERAAPVVPTPPSVTRGSRAGERAAAGSPAV